MVLLFLFKNIDIDNNENEGVIYMIDNILKVIGLFIIILIANKVIMPRLNGWMNKKYMLKRIDRGIIRKDDFYNMPGRSRKEILSMYVKNLGFTRLDNDDVFGKDIDYNCMEGTCPGYIKTYFEKTASNSDGSDVFKVGRPNVQKLLGQMVHDGVPTGIIITNGQFSGEAIEFAGQLPENHKIHLINGDELFTYFNSYILN